MLVAHMATSVRRLNTRVMHAMAKRDGRDREGKNDQGHEESTHGILCEAFLCEGQGAGIKRPPPNGTGSTQIEVSSMLFAPSALGH
jgi:hypothetical protein